MTLRTIVAVSTSVLLVGILAACAAFLVLMAHIYTQFDGDAIFPVDCAIVFGATVRKGSVAGPGILRRTSMAAYLYNNGQVNRLFLTGGLADDQTRSEAEVMRSVAIEYSVDPKDIVIEDQSRSTWENLENTKPLIDSCDSIVGISDRYHLARIQYLAEKQGWGRISVHPAGEAPALFELRSTVREALAFVYYGFLY